MGINQDYIIWGAGRRGPGPVELDRGQRNALDRGLIDETSDRVALVLSVASCSSGDHRTLLPIDATGVKLTDAALWISVTGATGGEVDKTFPGVNLELGATYKTGIYLTSGVSGALTITAEASLYQKVASKTSGYVTTFSVAK